MEEFKYLQKVTYTHKLVRNERYNGDGSFYRFWDKKQTPGSVGKEKCDFSEGIFLGWRYLKNGKARYYDEQSTSFIAEKTIKVAYVSPGPNKNPVYVMPEDMKPVVYWLWHTPVHINCRCCLPNEKTENIKAIIRAHAMKKLPEEK